MYRSRNLLKFWIITDNIPETVQDRRIHCVSKKRPTFTTCYNFYIHSSIATIFWHKYCQKSRPSKYTLFSHNT